MLELCRRIEAAVNADSDDGRFEPMGAWIVRMKYEMDRHKVYVVHRAFMKSAVLIVAML